MQFVELSGVMTKDQLDAIVGGLRSDKIASVDAAWNNGKAYLFVGLNDD